MKYDSSIETIRHEEALLLLSWLANGSLSDEECFDLQSHVAQCAECLAELEQLERLQKAISPKDVEITDMENTAADAALARMLQKIEANTLVKNPTQKEISFWSKFKLNWVALLQIP
ncbi:MAG: zf-HC2 domain-containing protein, partial [Gammaproteobacteria bacterium]|nr:zf-HC2 domain-containing protein [Gammaproteobacteria bacterium]